MALSLTFTGSTALGWMMRFNSSIEFLMKIKCLKILMPPEVEPEQPPMNMSRKRMTQRKTGQAV